jgi:hypothetical protein
VSKASAVPCLEVRRPADRAGPEVCEVYGDASHTSGAGI